MSEQIKKFTYKWNGNEWFWLDENPFRALSLEIKMVRAEDADALAERLAILESKASQFESTLTATIKARDEALHRLAECEAALQVFADDYCFVATEYFEKWGGK